MSFFRQFTLAMTLFTSSIGLAAEPSPTASNVMTPAAAIRQVWQQSPQLSGQAEQRDLAHGDQWRRFLINTPQAQYINSDDGTANAFGLSLTTSFPGKALAFIRSDRAKRNAQDAEYQAKKFDLAKSTLQAYLDCASSVAFLSLQNEIIGDIDTMSRTLRALYQSGHSTQAETIGAELQLRQANSDFQALADKTQVSCRKLGNLLKEQGDSGPEKFTYDLPDDLEPALLSEVGDETSDAARAEAAIEVAKTTGGTGWWNQLPDLTLSAQRNHYLYLPGSPSGSPWTTTYSIAMNIPIFFPFRESAEAKRITSQAEIDRDTAQVLLIAAKSDEEDAAREYHRSQARLTQIREKDLSLAEALVESTFSAYRSGKLGFAELTLARKTLADLKTQDIQLRISILSAHLRCLSRCDRPATKAVEESPQS